MVIVDTSVWIEFFRKDGDPMAKLAVGHLVRSHEAALCGPIEMEILGGVRTEYQPSMIDKLALYPSIAQGSKLWTSAAGNFSRLRAAGITAPWNDILIATIALAANFRIYSIDQHFPLMAPILGLRLYTPGYSGTFRPENEETS